MGRGHEGSRKVRKRGNGHECWTSKIRGGLMGHWIAITGLLLLFVILQGEREN